MSINQAVRERLDGIASTSGLPNTLVDDVFLELEGMGDLMPQTIIRELDFFCCKLGVDLYYFQVTPAKLIAEHIAAFYAARLLSKSGSEGAGPRLRHEGEGHAILACADEHNVAVELERTIEEQYPLYRVQSYRTLSPFASNTNNSEHLRLYFLQAVDFVADGEVPFEEVDIQKVGCRDFLARATESTIKRYAHLLAEAVKVRGPVIEISDKPETNEIRLMVAYKRIRTHSYFSAVSDVLNAYGIHTNRKYVEQFANGVSIFSLYADNGTSPEVLEQLREDLSLVHVLPRTSLTPLFREGKLSAPEVVYAYAGWKFVHQFLSRYSDAYNSIASVLREDPVRLGLLNLMKDRLSKDTFTEPRIYDTIFAYPEVIKRLYEDFAAYHFRNEQREPLGFDNQHNEALLIYINKAVTSEIDRIILTMFLVFNRHILKTNFYKNIKTSLAFRLDPSFLSTDDYPETPHGIFFVVGSEFRAFHIRFRDVARGGIRLVLSANKQVHRTNTDSLFNENYRLAYTQQRKNKDIPEGGSKGVILMSFEYQDKKTLAFKKYVAGLLDLMMPNEEIVDHFGKEELLFLGPDEGTADLMDWASLYAGERGYRFWKSFTTGKSVENGGIPHDMYGMTTRSVHQYVLGILRKQNREEENITKFQTGGPDGDLGSNEILLSADKTLSIVDGSGVLHDPNGIDRTELVRLARARQMVRGFDRNKLSLQGFFVDIEDREIILPDGEKIETGLHYRNTFHLLPRAAADFFVPCGGRPSAIHINNVEQLLDEKGKPRFEAVIEGANLFLTQEARFFLEERGVLIFKDASANKGGVTSSSLEVLSGLAMNDEEFAQRMRVRDGVKPDFYRTYVGEVMARIEDNATLEFERIWAEHERTGIANSLISDKLSNKINQLTDRIMASSLWDNPALRKQVLLDSFPKCLVEMLSYEVICQRVPEIYLQAIFGSYLASHYVYNCGLQANEIAFFEFVHSLLHTNGDV